MSMISSLIDELRKSADEWNSSNMFELARMCSEAADTIWQLRDDLQRANEAVRDAEHDESRAWDRVRKAEAENDRLQASNEVIAEDHAALCEQNAKLRELVADTLMQPRDYCQKYDIEYDSWDSVNEHLDARLRELGVEVEP